MKRVVITGVGPVSAAGIGREAFFDAVAEGRTGIRQGLSFETAGGPNRMAAEIRDFAVADYLESPKNYLDRASELAFAAMSLALEDADLDPRSPAVSAAGLSLGTAFGNLATMALFFGDFHRKGPRLVKPVLFPHAYSNTTISLLAMEYSVSGYHAHFASGMTASAAAIAAGFDAIREGRAGLVFAGGFESLNEILFAGHDRAGLLARDEGAGEAGRPFDRRRNGFVLGEGAGIVALEDLDLARQRGARIYGELIGAGLTGRHRLEAAMRAAAGDPQPGDVLLAHANGSRADDPREAAALAAWAAGAAGVRAAGIKPLTGETLGAGGAFQVIAALGILENQIVNPQPDHERDPACAGVPAAGPAGECRRVLANSADPGGAAACLCVQRMDA